MSDRAWGILSLVLVGVIAYLVVLDARTLSGNTYAAVAPKTGAPAFAARSPAPGERTEQVTPPLVEPPRLAQPEASSFQSPNEAALAPVLPFAPAAPALQSPSMVAPAPGLPITAPAAVASQSRIAVPPTPVRANLELIAPPEAVAGNSIEIQIGIRGASIARKAEIVLEYDATALLVLGPEQRVEGRAQATLRNSVVGEEFDLVAFQFDVLSSGHPATTLIATATTFDAAGNTVQVLPASRQEIVLRP